MTMPLNHDDCEGEKHDACRLEISELHSTMQRRWHNAVEMFREAHKNQVIKDLYSNLNHLNKLTSQLDYLRGGNRRRRRSNSNRLHNFRPSDGNNHQRQPCHFGHQAVPDRMPIGRRSLLPNGVAQQRHTYGSCRKIYDKRAVRSKGLSQTRLEAPNPTLRRE